MGTKLDKSIEQVLAFCRYRRGFWAAADWLRIAAQKTATIVAVAFLCLLGAALLSSGLSKTGFPFVIGPAVADDDDRKEREREAREHAREQAREEARERQREAQERARERAREEARRQQEEARERVRERQREARERAREAQERARREARERSTERQREADRNRRDDDNDRRRADERSRERESNSARRRDDDHNDDDRSDDTSRIATAARTEARDDRRRDDDDRRSDDRSDDRRSDDRRRDDDDDRRSDDRESSDKSDVSDSRDGDDRRRSRRSRRSRREELDASKNDTLVKVLKNLFSPRASPKPVKKAAAKPKSKAKSNPKWRPRVTRRRARGSVAVLPPRPGQTIMPNEVLATNLNAKSLRRARRMGFDVRSGTKAGGMSVTRLIAPRGMDARRAHRLLRRKLPQADLAFNRVYRMPHSGKPQRNRQAATTRGYREARGNEKIIDKRRRGNSKGRRVRRATGGRCLRDHCYASSIIKWQPALSKCARRVRIGLIDTSVDASHPAFEGAHVNTGKFLPPGSQEAKSPHGTGVLSVLAGNANSSTSGLISGAQVFAASIFFKDKSGQPVANTVGMIEALSLMERFGVKVINLSLTGPKDPLVEREIARLSRKGIIFVAAAGNNGPAAKPSYPAAYQQVIAVTAVNKKLRGYRYANRGAYIDLAAPGVDIWTAMPGARAGYQSGTSFAVPYVTATVAALYGQLPRKTKAAALKALKTRDLGKRGRDRVYGRGLLVAPGRCSPGRRSAPPAVMAAGASMFIGPRRR